MISLFRRLRERKLVQWGLAYLAVAWGILEVLGFLAANFGWPSFLVRAATVVFAFGFLAALVVAWHHGERGRQRVSLGEVVVLFGLAGAAVAAVAVLGPAPDETRAPPLAAAADAGTSRLAVLPFTSLSEDSEDAWFAQGITEDVQTALGGVGDLRVISPTSARRYRDRGDRTLGQIGEELRVRLILEGSVRRAGDRVRVVVHLVDTRADEEVWNRTFDRELTAAAIFDIQEGIATEIAEALHSQHHLALEDRGRMTESLEAYNHYLRGRYFFSQGGPRNLARAVDEHRAAIETDPEFALAHAALGSAWLAFAHFGQPPHTAFPRGIEAAERALALDSTVAEAHTVLADSRFHYEWDWEGAERRFRRGLELNPSFAEAHWWYAGFLAAVGRFEEAIGQFGRGLEVDPVAPLGHAFGARLHYWAGDHERAVAQAGRALELAPGFPYAHMARGFALMALGRAEEAVQAMERAAGVPGPGPRYALGTALAAAGREDEAREVLEELRAAAAEGYRPPYHEAFIHAALGERGAALDRLEAALETRDAELIWVAVEPVFADLREEPRFRALVRELGIAVDGAGS